MNCLLVMKIKWSLDINTGAVERSEAARARRLAGATVVGDDVIASTGYMKKQPILLTCAKFKVWMTIVESGWNVWMWLVVFMMGWVAFKLRSPIERESQGVRGRERGRGGRGGREGRKRGTNGASIGCNGRMTLL